MRQIREAETYQYVICLATQMGTRLGTLTLAVHGNKLDGTMNILGVQQHFSGERQTDGSCTLSGQLKTGSSLFDYTAVGRFDQDSILLDLKYKYGILRLTGWKLAGSNAAP